MKELFPSLFSGTNRPCGDLLINYAVIKKKQKSRVIVSNNCLMSRRKRKLEGLLESYDTAPDTDDENVKKQLVAWDSTPIEKLLNTELREKLDDAIQQLPAEYKVVFVLRDLENKSAEETAKITGLSVPAVKSRLRRSRIFLRNSLHEFMKQ